MYTLPWQKICSRTCSCRLGYIQLTLLVVLLTVFSVSPVWAFDTDLVIKEVTVSDTTPSEGDTITITVAEIENKGPTDPTPSVVVDIPLPAGLTYVTHSAPAGTSYDPVTGVWDIGSLADGPKLSLTIDATVDFGTGGSTLIPTATISSTDPTYNETNNGDNTRSRDIIVNAADLEVTKDVDELVPDEGQIVTFTINVRNRGDANATNVVIGDLLATTLTFVSATPDQGTYDEVAGEWTVGSVGNGDNFDLEIVATVNPGTSGTDIANTARVNSVDQSDDDLTNNSATVEMSVATPDLEVTKDVNDSSPDEGQAIQYEIKVENLGPAQATGVEITDLLPAGVTFSSIITIEQGTYTPATGIWDIGTLDDGDKVELVIEVDVDTNTAAQTITNRAEVTNLVQTDGDLSNNSASVDIFVNGADVAVTKTVDNVVPSELDTITYTIRVDNNGPQTANNVTITDILPVGVTYVSSVESNGDPYDPGAGTWFANDINAGDFETLTINATVDAGTTGSAIVNTASVTGVDEPDSITANNSDDALIVIGDADPQVSKGVNVTTADELDPIVYTVTVTNNGPDTAAAFVINDPLPAGLTYVSHSIAPATGTGTYNPVTGVWDYGTDTLAPLASAVLTINATVDTGTAAQTIVNTATLVPVQSGNNPANDVASASFQVNGSDIAVIKTVDNDRPAEGVPYTYTITVTNNGPDNATGVEITDQLPSGVSYVSDLPSQGTYDDSTGIWSVGSLINGASATLDIVATTGISSVNIATKTAADQPDSVTDNDSDSVSVAGSLTFDAGSCIIDMGVGVEQPDPSNPTIFQGYDKGLEPYSLLWELIRTYQVPVYWAINPDKTGFMPPPEAGADYTGYASALDFTADGKNYYGGSFIVPADFISPEIQTVLDTWDPDGNGVGPTVDCPATEFTAPIYNTVTSFPRAVLDEANGDKIESAFYDESLVPAESYRIGTPADLTVCDDIYAMPHADPQGWSDDYLTTFQDFINNGGSLWAACHAVSATETLADVPVKDGVNDYNFLTNRGLIEWGDHASGTPIDGDPTDYRYETSLGTDSLMQIVSGFDGSIQNGSEQIYLPLPDPIFTNTGELPTITDDPLDRAGGWRDSTTIAVWDPGHPDVENTDPLKIISPGKPALLAYGRAYGDENLGLVVYEASHTVAGGSEFENTSAARVYGNLLLQVGIERRPLINLELSVDEIRVGESIELSSSISGGTPPYTFEWTDSCGGTFSPSTIDANPTYTPPSDLTETTTCIIRLVLNDSCLRANFEAKAIRIVLPSVSGTVFNDTNGLNDGTVNGVGTDAGGLFVSLVDSSGNVVRSLPVNPDGTYEFVDVIPNADYTIQLNSAAQSEGAPPAAPDLPVNWLNTGENLGAGPGHDGTVDGILAIFSVGPDDVSEANFGIQVSPTAATIGSVTLEAVSIVDFLAEVGVARMDSESLLQVLSVWDPEAAATVYNADQAELLVALLDFLDPDLDGQVAVLRWDTLEERGTIGFFVERQSDNGDWVRINNDMMPGLVMAPMGGEYMLADPDARPGETFQYQLIEQEANGNARTYGPYNLEMP